MKNEPEFKIENLHVGKTIQFTSDRVVIGNPVSGVVRSKDDEWIGVELDHHIEGINTKWYRGEIKQFRITLIKDITIS